MGMVGHGRGLRLAEDYTIYNAGAFPCNRATEGMGSGTSVSLNFASREVVILGTQYAGEMKKGLVHRYGHWWPGRLARQLGAFTWPLVQHFDAC